MLRYFVAGVLLITSSPLLAQTAPFQYVPATAYHVMPGTHTDESGYFSLCEGKNRKMYVGTAAYGLNAYLIEFDPKTRKQRIVLDVNKLCGLATPTTPTYAAQSKIHTRNFVGPSGTIYVGSKQGYRRGKEDMADYPGGYVMSYDPATEKVVNYGIPYEGEGVNDVTADEKAGLIYVVTCEDHHWVIYDMKSKTFREPDPNLRVTAYAQTLIDAKGRAVVLTRDFKLARYEPKTNALTISDFKSDGKAIGTAGDKLGPACWALTADAKHAYLIRMSDPTLFRIDLTADMPTIPVVESGSLLEGKHHDSRGSLIVGHDQNVYALMRVDNTTMFGKGYLHHLVSYNPVTKKSRDHGVLAIKNPDFFDFGPGQDGKPKPWTHGYHTLPDKTLTPLHAHMSLIMAKNGRLYGTIIYPFTLFEIEPNDYR